MSPIESSDNPLSLPSSFQATIEGNWGARGVEWLRALPNLIAECAEEWNLTLQEHSFKLSYNYIVPVTRCDGTNAVLKIGLEMLHEMKALEEFHGKHSVALLEKNEARGAILLERIDPGTTLEDIQRKSDEEATRIAARLLRETPVPIPLDHSFSSVTDWSKILQKDGDYSIIPKEMIAKARSVLNELDSSKKEEKLLHGDLHHGNVLLDKKRGWLCIDPKGVIGDPAFNAARFLRNPYDVFSVDEGLSEMTERRIEILSREMNEDPKRIAGWGYVDAIIGACWSVESDGNSHEQALRAARALQLHL